MEEIRPTIEKIRRLFLSDGKARFEHLKFMFTSSQLHHEKPFVLLDQVYDQLNLTKEDFKPRSFRQWLNRYRKQKSTCEPNRRIAIKSEKIAPPVLFIKPEEKDPIEDDFKFTDPSTLKKEDDVILRIVQPKK